MGAMLFHLSQLLRGEFGFLNVFRYVSTRIGLATLTSLIITFALAPWFIRRARERQLGEVIREDGPATHASKKGTPTMGGALILLALVSATILWCDLTNPLVWPALFVTVGYGALGFVALATKTELALPIIGGVFVTELVSDIIQVAHFKRTGRRVFLMAPIHHHFEKLGWPESRIVVRFWIVSFACAILGLLLTLKVR